ncbi:alkyl/aryl-sulfatase [Sphingoaurantiacus capsulatus]|uniref:Alkyl/aryl-sulfatase n=1 Tax=Sphingoaurantiacus capsulatus TaxID=1771310 RepID=A0ABV7X948_9SPHN
MRGLIAISAILLGGTAQAAEPTAGTKAANAAVLKALPFKDTSDFDRAKKGFIGTLPDGLIRDAKGAVVRDLNQVEFLKGPAPDSVNPSLWRNAQLTAMHGLYEVTPGVWQVRGFDLSNMSIIRGATGYVVIDPLTTAEAARAAIGLVKKHLGDKPVTAVIYTHSHVDHFGGVRGVVDEADVKAGKVAIYAPAGFMEHAVSENVIAGNAMGRRASYMFGSRLPAGPQGHVGTGIGPRASGGSITLIAPTHEVKATGETATIDGVAVEFQLTPNSEAPAEMNLYLPALKALCLAENFGGSMHNILTPRGALIRDSKAWADYLTQSLRRYGDRTEALFTSHFWPRWGQKDIAESVALQRDAYKYLHDQSVRLMNRGYTGIEIGNMIELPPVLASAWFNRGNYGSPSFNARAVYQRYMGHYDGNPSNLNPLPPEDVAKRYVAALGGSAKLLSLAADARKAGDERWAVELLKQLVFAEPQNTAAKAALADALEQLGYRAESAPWRNIYLSGAQELRGAAATPASETAAFDVARAMPMSSLLDLLAVRLDPEKAGNKKLKIAFVAGGERHLVSIANGVLIHEAGAPEKVEATITAPTAAILAMLGGQTTARELMGQGVMKIDGNPLALLGFGELFDRPPTDFPLVTP